MSAHTLRVELGERAYPIHIGTGLVDDAMPYDRIPTKKDRRLVFIEYVEIG